MRKGGKTFGEGDRTDKPPAGKQALDYDAGKFWNSFFKASADSGLSDRATIGPMVTETASRFHFNAVENGIIRAISHREELPYGWQVATWEFAQRRRELRLVDVGSGSGHWIDFFREALYVTTAIGIEVAPTAVEGLREKYAGQTGIEIVKLDIGAADFPVAELGCDADYISAIGVLFHVVDDEKWLQALRNMKALLAPDGLLFVGGDFGDETKNLQYHQVDVFETMNETATASDAEEVLVNKRVRSLAEWKRAVATVDMEIVDLIRVDADRAIHTPENDLLVLTHQDS
jgi:SAM-dependent methyltransferase